MHTWENQSYWWTFLTTSSLSLSVRTLTTIGVKAGQTLSARQNLYWVLQQCLQQLPQWQDLMGEGVHRQQDPSHWSHQLAPLGATCCRYRWPPTCWTYPDPASDLAYHLSPEIDLSYPTAGAYASCLREKATQYGSQWRQLFGALIFCWIQHGS